MTEEDPFALLVAARPRPRGLRGDSLSWFQVTLSKDALRAVETCHDPARPAATDARTVTISMQWSLAPISAAGYGLTSVVTSAVVMRGQGLNWGPIAVMIVAPLVLLAAARWAHRSTDTTVQHSAN